MSAGIRTFFEKSPYGNVQVGVNKLSDPILTFSNVTILLSLEDLSIWSICSLSLIKMVISSYDITDRISCSMEVEEVVDRSGESPKPLLILS